MDTSTNNNTIGLITANGGTYSVFPYDTGCGKQITFEDIYKQISTLEKYLKAEKNESETCNCENECEVEDFMDYLIPDKVIFSDIHTIGFFGDEKVVVKLFDGDVFSFETGFMELIMRRLFQSRSNFLKYMRRVSYIQAKNEKGKSFEMSLLEVDKELEKTTRQKNKLQKNLETED